ncbi:hypothetical protein LSH36_2260g00007 [Paralvinella palmiformis]|uniref:Uncharacterized protein n=1 Tax=Paralvinella palmiformis TaxID=53620 RepID=A0AAD9IQW6_9ANNE|nr:hypothetical protein LSH36_2260g00007 [Paralvinella palmiformis]
MDTSAPRPDIPESQGPEETSMEGFTMVKNKRTRDQSPKTVSPLRKHPRPNGIPEPKQVSIRFKIRIVKTEGWASAFEIALALFKTHPHLELSQTINREGHTILSTVMEKTRDYVVSMTKLTGRTVKFELLEDGPPEKRYAIVGVPLEVEPDYFIGLHHITKADSTASQSHASSVHAHRQSPMDQKRLSGLQPGNRLPGTHISDTGNNSCEYTTTTHSPHQPPRDKYGQCCGGHHGAYEPHLVTDEQSDRAHKDSPRRPKEKRGCCFKRRATENNRGDTTPDCTGKSKNPQTDSFPHPPTKHYPEDEGSLHTRPAPQASILKWNTRRADWVKYSQTLQTLTPDIPPNIDIDIHLDSILEAVQSAADISVPRHTQAKHNRRTNYIPPEGPRPGTIGVRNSPP